MNKRQIGELFGGLGLGLAAFLAVWYGLPLGLPVLLPAAFCAAAALSFCPGLLFALAAFFAPGFLTFGTAFFPMAALAAVAGLGGFLVFRKAGRALDALIGCCAVSLLSTWANLFAGVAIGGREVLERVFTADPALLDALEQSYRAVGYGASAAQAIRAELAASYAEMVPGVLLVTAMAAGLLGFAAGSMLARKKLRYRVPPFSMWRMPRGYLLGGVLLMLAALGAEALGWQYAEPVKLAVELMLLGTYSVQGLAVLWFFLGRTRLHPALRVVVLLAIVALAGSMLMLLAVMEDFLQLRRRMPPPGWKNGGTKA